MSEIRASEPQVSFYALGKNKDEQLLTPNDEQLFAVIETEHKKILRYNALIQFLSLASAIVFLTVIGLAIMEGTKPRPMFKHLVYGFAGLFLLTLIILMITLPIIKRKKKQSRQLINQSIRKANKKLLQENKYWEYYKDAMVLHSSMHEGRIEEEISKTEEERESVKE